MLSKVGRTFESPTKVHGVVRIGVADEVSNRIHELFIQAGTCRFPIMLERAR